MHTLTKAATMTGLALTLASLTGCFGHGKYTTEGISLAEERMSLIKSATEWDLARQAFLGGDLEKALDRVNSSLSINDTVVKSHVLKGRILIEQGNLTGAITSLERAQELDEEDSDTHYYLGVVYERLARPETALGHFMRAFEIDESAPVYAVAGAEMLIELDRADEARAFLEAIPASENHAGIRQTLGQIALIQKNAPLAEKHLRDARLLAPSDDIILEQLIHAQMLNAKFNDADRNISALIARPEHKGRRDLLILRGRALMGTDRAIEARTIYNNLILSDQGQSDLEAWIGLGHASLALHDARQARRAASRVVAIAPQLQEGFVLWAMIHRREGSADKALVAINDAIARDASNAELYAFKAVVLRDLGQAGQALANATHASTMDPTSAQYRVLIDSLQGAPIANVPTGD